MPYSDKKSKTSGQPDKIQDEFLREFYSNLPPKPKCTDEFYKGVHPLKKSKASQKRYIEFNPPWGIRWVVFDVDSPEALTIWQDANLPQPHIIVRNPKNGHAHWYYLLHCPIKTFPDSRGKAIAYLNSIKSAFCRACANGKPIGIDKNYKGKLAQNPFHAEWECHVHPVKGYSLKFLASHIKLKRSIDIQNSTIDGEPCLIEDSGRVGTRNNTLFHRLRKIAYREYRTRKWAYQEWDEHITSIAFDINNTFNPPLPSQEVHSTAGQIIKWVLNEYQPLPYHAKRLGLSADAQQVDIARAAQQRQAESRRARTTSKILEAVASLRGQGKRVTNGSVAALAGCSTATVQRYSDLLPRNRTPAKNGQPT